MSLLPPNGNWKVTITSRAWDRFYVDLLIYRELDDGNIRVLYITDTNTWQFSEQTIPIGITSDSIKPTLRLPAGVLQAMMPALQEQGIRAPDEHKIAGLYEATKYHLEDLRALLKIDSDKTKDALTEHTIFGETMS